MKRIQPLFLFLLGAACVETHEVSVTPTQANHDALAIASAYMSDHLKDPESLKVRRVTHYRTAEGDDIVCGEMDARNSFGGYNGYSAFYVRMQGQSVRRAFFGDDGHYTAKSGCDDARSGLIKVAS